MSILNESNRPQLLARLGDVTADSTFLVLYAQKKLVIVGAAIVAHVDVAAGSGANNVAFKLIDRAADGDETDVAAAVNNDGVAVDKGEILALNVPEDYSLDEGHSLILSADVTGAGAFSPCALALDYLVVGS